MVNIIIRNFTGKTFSLDVDLESSVATLKEAIANAKPTGNKQLWQIETHLTFNGFELRDHRALSHYGIVQGNTLRVGEWSMLLAIG
jgi:Ubiquitin family